MEYKDYYQIIGVAKNASEKEIQQAYRRLARKYHPDVNPDNKAAQEKFKEINEAYQVISDADKRRKYDSLGANWQAYEQHQRAGSGGGGPFQWGNYRTASSEDFENIFGNAGVDASDFFRTFFGGGFAGARGAARARRGQDIEQALQISLEEAHNGTARLVQKDSRRLEIKIPAGVRSGSRIRYAGEGMPGAGSAPGDMYFQIQIAPHEIFERREDDIYYEAPVDLYTAILGGEITVPTLKGQGALKIPAGTQTGKIFRLSGQGMPKLDEPGKFGDMYVQARVRVPEKLSAPEKELFQKLAKMRKAKS